jgi:hypothetical protein
LITALVGFVILFVAATIYAIYFNAQWTKATNEAAEEKAQRLQYASDNDVKDADVKRYADAAKKQSVVHALMAERDTLANAITGQPKTATASAAAAAQAARKAADDELAKAKIQGVTVPGDLATAVKNLADAIITVDGERKKAQADADAAAAKTVQVTTDQNAMLKAKDDQIAAVTADAAKNKAEIEVYRKEKGDSIVGIQADADQKLKDVQAAADIVQKDGTKKDAVIKTQEKKIAELIRRLLSTRVNVTEAMVQQADGTILRAPSQNTVFINIGQKQSVTPGLTFEVYDKVKGIPPMGDGMRDAQMPEGKASIEVIHVLPTSAECRVIHTALGETLTEGDLIMNLVFDPNAHYKFLVYGKFDMSNEGTPNAADADVVKRLVTQWGGRLATAADVNTDFVVLGAVPVVPILSPDDQNDPGKVKGRDDKQAELDAFLKVQADAGDLGIPLMNQNRFLYFVGYYDQSAK